MKRCYTVAVRDKFVTDGTTVNADDVQVCSYTEMPKKECKFCQAPDASSAVVKLQLEQVSRNYVPS